jgi:translation initiation factor 2 alpha subunit (eIF-2alpha)
MTTILSADGLLEIPEAFRKADALKPGQRCDIERLGLGEYRVRVQDQNVSESEESWVDVLLACPVKGWFEPIERHETTDDLKSLSFE